MQTFTLVTRLSVPVLMLCTLITILAHLPGVLFKSLVFILFFTVFIDALAMLCFQKAPRNIPKNRILATIFSASPLSNWNPSRSSVLSTVITFFALTVAALAKLLGYW